MWSWNTILQLNKLRILSADTTNHPIYTSLSILSVTKAYNWIKWFFHNSVQLIIVHHLCIHRNITIIFIINSHFHKEPFNLSNIHPILISLLASPVATPARLVAVEFFHNWKWKALTWHRKQKSRKRFIENVRGIVLHQQETPRRLLAHWLYKKGRTGKKTTKKWRPEVEICEESS